MSGEEFEGFSGYGFSLKDEKGRFAIPVDFRTDLKNSSAAKTICLDIHPEWECVSAFGLSRKRDFGALIEQARQDAAAANKPFDRLTWQAQLNAFDKVAFDDSGRFIMPPDLVETFAIDDALYWHSVGDHIVVFTPETLYDRGPAFMRPRCHRLEREARAKAAAKGAAK
ncbi:MAG: division/cell wall cluster transcriptional repressor MraZ [Sphingomonadaceae bacterium]